MPLIKFFRNLFLMVLAINILMYLAIFVDVVFHSSNSIQQHNWEKGINSVTVGETKTEVLKALGKPAKEDNDQWVYTCPGFALSGQRWCVGTISFDKSERVDGHTFSAPNSLDLFR